MLIYLCLLFSVFVLQGILYLVARRYDGGGHYRDDKNLDKQEDVAHSHSRIAFPYGRDFIRMK